MARKTNRKVYLYNKQRSATNDDVDIGMRIRLRRIQLNLSQRKVGKSIGVSSQQIQKYENGTNRIPCGRFLELCRMLDVDPNYLLGWQGQSLKVDETQTNDALSLRIAQSISLLPSRTRASFHALIRSLGQLSAAELARR